MSKSLLVSIALLTASLLTGCAGTPIEGMASGGKLDCVDNGTNVYDCTYYHGMFDSRPKANDFMKTELSHKCGGSYKILKQNFNAGNAGSESTNVLLQCQ